MKPSSSLAFPFLFFLSTIIYPSEEQFRPFLLTILDNNYLTESLIVEPVSTGGRSIEASLQVVA
jgi:hypothetical protein